MPSCITPALMIDGLPCLIQLPASLLIASGSPFK